MHGIRARKQCVKVKLWNRRTSARFLCVLCAFKLISKSIFFHMKSCRSNECRHYRPCPQCRQDRWCRAPSSCQTPKDSFLACFAIISSVVILLNFLLKDVVRCVNGGCCEFVLHFALFISSFRITMMLINTTKPVRKLTCTFECQISSKTLQPHVENSSIIISTSIN